MSTDRTAPFAFYFGEEDQKLFGWLHPSCSPGDTGVVLCASLWREELYSHRTLLHLADAAASAGMPALRFDYDGTGDSSGDEHRPGLVSAWARSVHAAMDELKRRTGVRRLCLIGLRLGAALAMVTAAERDDTIAILAIAPVVSGKALMRELRMLSGSAATSPAKASEDALLEVGGFFLTRETQDAIASINLLDVAPSAGLTLRILDRDDAPGAERWTQVLVKGGARVEYSRVPGYAGMMETAALNVMPRELIAAATQWLRGLPRQVLPPGAPHPPMPTESACPTSCHIGDVQEAAVLIAAGVNLPGILSEPRPGRRLETPSSSCIVLLNAGIARRIGPSRMYVDLARRWASLGHTVLRLDLSGIGDSKAHPGQAEHSVYSGSAVDEVMQAITFIRSRTGASRCVVVGLCAGAYHGFKAAVAGAPLDAVVLINPLTFNWKPGDSLTTTLDARAVTRVMSNYRRSALSREAWLRVFSRKAVISRVVKRTCQFVSMRVHTASCELLKRLGLRIPGNLGSDLEALGHRGVQTHFIFASGEPGPTLLRIHAGSSIERLERQGLLSRADVPDADHIFTRLQSRHRLIRLLDAIMDPTPRLRPIESTPPALVSRTSHAPR